MTNDRERIRKILIFPNFYCPNYFSLFFLANINSGLTSGELCILISGPTLHTDWTRQLFFQHAVKMEVSSFLSRFTQQCWWGTSWSGWLSYLDQYHQLPIPSAGPTTGCEEKISGDFALLVRSAVRYQASSHSWPHPNCSLERARYSAIRNRDLFIRYFKSGCLLLGLTFHYSTLGLLSELSKLSIHVETSKKFFKQGATHWGESVRCQM